MLWNTGSDNTTQVTYAAFGCYCTRSEIVGSFTYGINNETGEYWSIGSGNTTQVYYGQSGGDKGANISDGIYTYRLSVLITHATSANGSDK